jgi:hypothetical protein
MENTTSNAQECCPKFIPEPWDNQFHEWKGKQFIRDHVFTLWFMPLNFGKVMTRMMTLVEKSGQQEPDYLCLSDHTSKWNMDIYLAVKGSVAGADNKSLSGKYFSKVYEGSFKESGKWMKDFSITLKNRGLKAKKHLWWYTTCPKCAKKYGKNYVVVFAGLD